MLDGFFLNFMLGRGDTKIIKTLNMLKIGQEQLFYLGCGSLSVLVTGIDMAAVHNDGY
jgi:hypothetical protein